MRYVIIGFTVKDCDKEFSSVKGYSLDDNLSLPCHARIREEALEWANRDGDDFAYFKIDFIKFLSKEDYNSFMGVCQP